MKRFILFATVCFVAISMFALEVNNLKTQAYTNPIGIDITTPSFSWMLSSTERGVVQVSYNIKVSTERDFSDVVWESGTIESNLSTDVMATGFSPKVRTRYYWQVTVTDNKGNAATSQERAYFETGLKTATAWNSAKWIKATTNPKGGDSSDTPSEIKDYEVELKFQIQQLAAGLIFAAKDHNNYYMWQVNTLTGSPRFRPHRWQNGGAACLSENALGVNVQNGEVHTLRIEVRDASTATTYVDGVQVDTRTGDFVYGDFGFREDYDNGNVAEQAFFDDFVVTSGGKILLQEHFDTEEGKMFNGGSVQDGRLYVSGPANYCWQLKMGKYVHYDIEADMTLVQDNASICFSATATDTYMMWAINTFDVSQPVVRRHVYNAGALTYNDTPIQGFTKADLIGKTHHIRIACETPYVRTYIDDKLVDTFVDASAVLAVGDVGFRVSATGNEREKAYFDNLKVTSYDAEGNASVTLSEDFEQATSIFDNADVRDYDGSRQVYMEAAVGNAKRMMQSDGSVLPGAPMMRKTFAATAAIKRARLYATGLGVYNVYINGTRVGITHDDGTTEQDELKPGFTEFLKTVFYTTHDVTALIHEGDNAIGAELTSGWWSGAISHGMYGSKPVAFRALLILTYEDGSEKIIPTDTSWSCNTNGALRKGDIYNGETYDARLESNWSEADFDDTDWFATAVSNDFQGTIRAFEGPAIKAVPALARQPKTITIYEGTRSNGKTYGAINTVSELIGQNNFQLKAGQTAIIDLAQNAAGWVSFTAKGERGTRLRFRFGEMPNTTGDRNRGDDGPAGSVYTENLRSAEASLYYTLKGAEEGESFHPTTTFMGFRYIEVVSSADVELTNVVGETVTSAMDERSSFKTSHPDVNQLYSNCMWGQRSNFLSVPTDCPQRDERQGWTADTQVYSMAGLYNADTRMFYEKFMRDMRDSQRSDGAFPHIAPYAWGVGHGAAAWADAGVILPWNVYLMTGDKQIIKDNWTAMENYMNFLSTKTEGSYKYNGGETTYGDWVAYVNTDSRYCSVCYYALDAQLMAKMARVLSTSETDSYAQKAKQYDELFQNIKAEWQTRYAISSTGVPNINTQCAYLMALHYNLLRDENAIKRTKTALRNAISNNGYKLNTGFLGTAILNQTLTENGLNDEAYTLLLQRNDPSWLYSIDQGATTIWERWNSYTKTSGYGPVSMNSFNHYAYGIIAEWMFRHMAGICPDEENAGFKHFILRPNPDTRKILRYQQKRITSVDANFWSVYGPIKAAWVCEGGADITYDVTIPANTTATLYMPVAEGYELKESGQPISECSDIEYLGMQDGRAVCRLGSGSYRFSVDNATAIHNSQFIIHNEGEVYDLGGRKIDSSLFTLHSSLKKGVYIQEGIKKAM